MKSISVGTIIATVLLLSCAPAVSSRSQSNYDMGRDIAARERKRADEDVRKSAPGAPKQNTDTQALAVAVFSLRDAVATYVQIKTLEQEYITTRTQNATDEIRLNSAVTTQLSPVCVFMFNCSEVLHDQTDPETPSLLTIPLPSLLD